MHLDILTLQMGMLAFFASIGVTHVRDTSRCHSTIFAHELITHIPHVGLAGPRPSKPLIGKKWEKWEAGTAASKMLLCLQYIAISHQLQGLCPLLLATSRKQSSVTTCPKPPSGRPQSRVVHAVEARVLRMRQTSRGALHGKEPARP